MQVGQRVLVQKNEIVFHKWYEAHIIEIRKKRPASQGTPKWCIYDVITCCSNIPLEYVVRYSNDTTQIVTADRIMEYDINK